MNPAWSPKSGNTSQPRSRPRRWVKVASQAAIFTEDRIRRWAGRPVGEVGKDLAVAIFGKSGQRPECTGSINHALLRGGGYGPAK